MRQTMAMRHLISTSFVLALVAGASVATAQQSPPARSAQAAPPKVLSVDRVVAIVNDEAITQHEVNDLKRVVLVQMAQKVQPPSSDVLEKQVLERLITERSLLQFAKETGLRIDDTQVERAIQRIAQDNKLSLEDFRKALAQEKITYAKYRDDIRTELVMQRLREREIESRLTVSDAEVDHYLATLKAQNAGDSEYQSIS